jgi:uncharacterized protein (TIGR00369 family)
MAKTPLLTNTLIIEEKLMSIWKKQFNLERLNSSRTGTMVDAIGIEITDFGEDYICATMPVDSRTHQPMGILHGGASVALAETVGSIAANMAVSDEYYCVGLDINANHLRPVSSGLVTAKTTPLHIGRTTQVWEIKIINEDGKAVCISRLTMAVIKKNSAD